MSRVRLTFPCALAALAIALTACGGGDGNGGEAEGPASYAPAEVPVYIEAAVEPLTEGSAEINSLARKVAGVDDPVGLLITELESSAADEGLEVDFEADVEPWLGERSALFVVSVSEDEESQSGAVVVETSDEAAAQEFLDEVVVAAAEDGTVSEASYEGTDYRLSEEGDEPTAFGVVDGAVVAGDEQGFQSAIDALNGDSLAGQDSYEEALGELEDQGLGHLFVDTARLVEQSSSEDEAEEAENARAVFGDLLEEPFIASIDVERDRVTLDLSGPSSSAVGDGAAGELLAEVPPDAVAAFTVADLGGSLQSLLDRLREQEGEQADQIEQGLSQIESMTGIDLSEDILSWMGDAAIFGVGESERDAALGIILTTTDPDASAEALESIAGFAGLAGGGPGPDDADAGFFIDRPEGAVFVAQRGERIVITAAGSRDPAVTLNNALAGGGGKGATDLGAALDEGFEPAGYVDFGAIVAIADRVVPEGDRGYAQAREVLTALERLVFGSSPDDPGRGQAVITVR